VRRLRRYDRPVRADETGDRTGYEHLVNTVKSIAITAPAARADPVRTRRGG
jgi:hypothetical protein